jgi:hypothetical protein
MGFEYSRVESINCVEVATFLVGSALSCKLACVLLSC